MWIACRSEICTRRSPPMRGAGATRVYTRDLDVVVEDCFPRCYSSLMLRKIATYTDMRYSTSLGVTLSLLAFSDGLPTSKSNEQSCDALIERVPWHVSDLIVQDSPSAASTGFSIKFRISDNNPGLELDTFCTDRLQLGRVGWQSCDDEQMRFRYNPENLLIQRSYIDDWYVIPGVMHEGVTIYLGACSQLISAYRSLGVPPHNGGLFYGNANLLLQAHRTVRGEIRTQTALEVPVTSQT
jgi:hypothetical protein